MPIRGTTSVDLTSVGSNRIPSTFELEGNELGHAEEMLLHLPTLDAEAIQRLILPGALAGLSGQRLTGSLDDGKQFEAVIGIATGMKFTDDGKPQVKCLLKNVKFLTPSPAKQESSDTWVFRMANLRFRIGDEKTFLPVPSGREMPLRPFVNNKIRFTLADREWTMTDDLMATQTGREDANVSTPILSGTLTTPIRPGDSWEEVAVVADDLGYLLSLASSKGVRSLIQMRVDANGACLESRSESVWLPPFREGGHRHIDQWEAGALKKFLEDCYPAYARDREWFCRTLDMFLQSQMNKFIEVKTAILNTLLDRIQQYVNGKSLSPQIDPQLSKNVENKVFKWVFHRLLMALSRKWDPERTEALIQTIKDWNARPSFPKGVELACAGLGISAPPKKVLGKRHKLIHLGELDLRSDKAIKYWEDLDLLVLLMILRLLKYNGILHHHKLGYDPVHIQEVLVDTANT